MFICNSIAKNDGHLKEIFHNAKRKILDIEVSDALRPIIKNYLTTTMHDGIMEDVYYYGNYFIFTSKYLPFLLLVNSTNGNFLSTFDASINYRCDYFRITSITDVKNQYLYLPVSALDSYEEMGCECEDFLIRIDINTIDKSWKIYPEFSSGAHSTTYNDDLSSIFKIDKYYSREKNKCVSLKKKNLDFHNG